MIIRPSPSVSQVAHARPRGSNGGCTAQRALRGSRGTATSGTCHRRCRDLCRLRGNGYAPLGLRCFRFSTGCISLGPRCFRFGTGGTPLGLRCFRFATCGHNRVRGCLCYYPCGNRGGGHSSCGSRGRGCTCGAPRPLGATPSSGTLWARWCHSREGGIRSRDIILMSREISEIGNLQQFHCVIGRKSPCPP